MSDLNQIPFSLSDPSNISKFKSGIALSFVSLLNRVTVKTVGEKASRQPTFGSAALLYKMRTKRHFEFFLSFTVSQYRKTMKLDFFR